MHQAPTALPKGFKTPLTMFLHWEQTQPDKVWLQQCHPDGDITYTYAEAGILARCMAAGLLARGLTTDDKVGIYSNNMARWVLLDLALIMAGLVSVPIYATMPEDKIRYIVEHSDMKVLFVGDQCALTPTDIETLFPKQCVVGLADGVKTKTTWEELSGNSPLAEIANWTNEKLWTITYTSGTTGQPKGVMHSLSSIPSSAKLLADSTGLNADARFFSYLPLAHIAERCVVEMHCFYCGGMIGFNYNLETFSQDLFAIKPHYFNAVPRIWANLKSALVAKIGEQKWQAAQTDPAIGKQLGQIVLEQMGLGDCIWAQSGSAPIAPSLLQDWLNLGLPIVEGYGLSETMNGLINNPKRYKVGSVGRSFTPEEACISKDGELLLGSAGNMLGYYKEPEKTAATIIDGWIHTGDKATVDSEGYYAITGRVKEIFKTGKGKYVAPVPIESLFAKLGGVAQCCLIGRGMAQPVMLMVADPALKPSIEAIENQLNDVNEQLEAHEKIQLVLVCKEPWSIENDLLTHTMKMLRDDIERNYLSLVEQSVAAGDKVVVYEELLTYNN